MRILFITQYFYPETFRGNDAVFYLAEKGFHITVLTAIPNYPGGKFYKDYGLFSRRFEIINGVHIIRVPVFPRGKGGKVSLALNYMSYMFFGSVYSIFLALFRKYDLILAQQLSPATSVLPGLIIRKIQKIPFLLWVLDLWPESLQSAGGTNNKLILTALERFMKHVYTCSDKILISSKGFADSINSKGNFSNKIIYFPNWAENDFQPDDSVIIPSLPNGFKIMYAGNIGEAQDFSTIMKAILLIKQEKGIKFIFIGEGRKFSWLKDFVLKNQLEDIVTLLGRYPLNTMSSFFKEADAMLLSLKDDIILSKTAPAKLQAYMSSGKPILGMINGDGSDIIQEAECGFVAPAGDFEQLAANILKMKNLPRESLVKMGQSGLSYLQKNFNREKCMSILQNIILNYSAKD